MGYQHLQVSRSVLNDPFLCSSLAVSYVGGKGFYRTLQLFSLALFSDELRSQVFVFPILGAIASKLPWEGEGSLLQPNVVEHFALS